MLENVIWVGSRTAIPLLLACVGEIYAERSGVLNLGVEGMMAMGAAISFIVALQTHNAWLGVSAGVLAAMSLSLIHAFISISLRSNQVVSGLAISMLGLGLSILVGRKYVGFQLPPDVRFLPTPMAPLNGIPLIGRLLFDQDPIFYISLLLTLLLWFLLFRTRYGLIIRSTGGNPAAVDAAGISVEKVRYASTLLGGALSGLAGAYLSTSYNPVWIENITAGRGWIAISLVIFSLWDPAKALLTSFLFGTIEAASYTLQALGYSQWLLSALPYLMTLVILTLGSSGRFRRRVGAPRYLGIPYDRE
ncbi:MAG: ABC transporter permease [Candidatus Korarchaeota archaeon NZ13-K]|nr:MAG: ABC transporter permease [Candidatus Korarchaeota archaeon NZ13-K]